MRPCLAWAVAGYLASLAGALPPILWSADLCPAEPESQCDALALKECGMLRVPIGSANFSDWLSPLPPGRATIDVFVRRYRAAQRSVGAATRGPWVLLSGGPGEAGLHMIDSALCRFADEPFDFYVPDQRGTGRSFPLACPAAHADGEVIPPVQYQACLDEVRASLGHDEAALSSFSTSAAALDVRMLLLTELEHRRDEWGGRPPEVVVHGASYGTLLATRILQHDEAAMQGRVESGLPPGSAALATRVILDGVVYPPLYGVGRQTGFFTAALNLLADACTRHAECRRALGGPTGRVQDTLALVFDRVSGGTHAPLCPDAGVSPWLLRRVLAFCVSLTNWRHLPLAFLARLLRCDPDRGDVAVLRRMWAVLSGLPSRLDATFFTPSEFSIPLLLHVALSEGQDGLAGRLDYWTNQGPPLERAHLAQFVPEDLASFAAAFWPTYRDPLSGRVPARINASVLLMNGGLDANTPLPFASRAATDLRTAFTAQQLLAEGSDSRVISREAAAAVQLIVVPSAGHIVLNRAPVAAACVKAWLAGARPSALNVTRCLGSVPRISVLPTAEELAILGQVGVDAADPFALADLHPTATRALPTLYELLVGAIAGDVGEGSNCDLAGARRQLHVVLALAAIAVGLTATLSVVVCLGVVRFRKLVAQHGGSVVLPARGRSPLLQNEH